MATTRNDALATAVLVMVLLVAMVCHTTRADVSEDCCKGARGFLRTDCWGSVSCPARDGAYQDMVQRLESTIFGQPDAIERILSAFRAVSRDRPRVLHFAGYENALCGSGGGSGSLALTRARTTATMASARPGQPSRSPRLCSARSTETHNSREGCCIFAGTTIGSPAVYVGCRCRRGCGRSLSRSLAISLGHVERYQDDREASKRYPSCDP